ncbi:TonB-dependent receptor [Hymenobacter jeollabukensis]|uniref:TonB-dependent receptor n=1 Tax=Hymenobacter jeollabukensis TaxID=2025313 RepID=A0A5R8WK87_9BACT|nr:TonB-dependent receptor [Hymenobacter jeollabukensis]TLM89442.1 TonB-dependent receptor [Hymenobacter jeollabukensis]
MRFSSFRAALALLLLLLAPLSLLAQVQYLLRGTVRGTDGSALPGANVAVPATGLGTATDADGRYELRLPAGRHRVVASFIGYKTATEDLNLRANQRLDLVLGAGNELQEVVIEGSGTLEQKLQTTQMGVERLSAREAKLLPALFGEVDILKTLQLKPGVQNGGEGTSGLFVRGGSADQNLFLVDDAVVYNPNHLFGLFSTFNSDVVQSVDLYKSGFPAQYGGRLSSVVDVKLREGSRDSAGVSGGIGLISSRLAVETPIAKGKGSILLAGRRTYFDVFTRQINKLNKDTKDYNPIPDYYFYDLNLKANYQLTDKDQVFLSGYFGNDVFGFNSTRGFNFDFHWGNRSATARWSHVFSPKLFTNSTATWSYYTYNIANKLDQFSFGLGSNIRDWNLRSDWEWRPNDKHIIRFGGSGTLHHFGVGRLQANGGSFNIGQNVEYDGLEGGLYAADNFTVNDKLALDYGLRLTGFQSGTNEYGGLEPRAAARYSLTPRLSVKASYALMYQYVHLVTNSGASLPTDIWYPSRLSVKPQRSQQVSTGFSWLIGSGQFLLTDEVYYKWAQRQIDFRDGAQLFVNPELDQEFLFGRGWAYGNEIYLEKKQGKTTGWLGYTLAWTKREFEPQRGTTGINGGRAFFPTYDRRHNLTLVVLHKLNKRVNLTSSFVYTSGNPTTLPTARIGVQDVYGGELQAVPIYPDRNSFRLPSYHRLDLGVVYKLKPWRKIGGESDLTLSIYNAYNRRNPYFIYIDEVKNEETGLPERYRARQVSLFPVIPSLTYNFKF